MGRHLRRVHPRRPAGDAVGRGGGGLAPGGRGRGARLIRLLTGVSLVALALLGLPSCAGGDDRDRVLVLAASSLTEAFRALAPLADGGADFSFGASQVLVEQVEQGAPADVLAVADPALLGDGAVVFARNALVVVAAPGSPVQRVDDLAAPGTRVVLAAEGVPAGRYGRDGLAALGLLEGVLANVVSDEPDVKAVAAKVGLGEADAGVVYATDARADRRLEVVGDPLPVEVVYAAEVVEGAPHPGEAAAFVRLLASTAGQRVLQEKGFGVPRP